MIFYGVSKQFLLDDEQQYDTIGQFWDEMALLYGLESLQGLGYLWQDNEISYAIGLKQGCIDGYNVRIDLPNVGLETANGKTECLKEIYDEIYKSGPLQYELELFYEDGSCMIQYLR